MLQPPLTFNQFLKNPITGMLFLCLIALGYMMWDTKQVTKRQEERIMQLEQEVRKANQDIQKLSEENGAMRAELNLRKEYQRQK
jgi:Tfp pilus assembly protein PilN